MEAKPNVELNEIPVKGLLPRGFSSLNDKPVYMIKRFGFLLGTIYEDNDDSFRARSNVTGEQVVKDVPLIVAAKSIEQDVLRHPFALVRALAQTAISKIL